MQHTHDPTNHPISKDWDGFDWEQAQYHEKNVIVLEKYREMPPTSSISRGLRINAELRTAGRMSLDEQRTLLVSVKTGLHSFEIAEDPSDPLLNMLLDSPAIMPQRLRTLSADELA